MVNTKIITGIIILLLFIILNIFIWNLPDDEEEEVEEIEEPKTLSDKELANRYDSSLKRILQEEIENCKEGSTKEEGLPLRAFVENDISICEQSQDKEHCESNYHLFNLAKNGFVDCEQINHDEKNKLCEIMRDGTPSDCDKVEEETSLTKEWCLAIIKEDINECEDLPMFEKIECQLSNIFIESSYKNYPENCKKIKELDYSYFIDKPEYSIKDYIRSFSNLFLRDNYIMCKTIAKEDISIFDEYVEEKCYLDTIVARANKFACQDSKQELREECKEKTEKLVECLESDKDNQQKKACVKDLTHKDIFCKQAYAKNKEDVINKTEDHTSKRDELIHLNPEICVI